MVRAVARTLDEHWRQRERGVPTLSVLCGPDPAARAEWRSWAGQSGIISDATAPDSMVLALAVAVRPSLYAAALRRVALRAGVSSTSVVRSAASGNAGFAKLLEVLDSSATEECCRAALTDLPFPGSPETLLHTLDELRIALPPVFLSAGMDALAAAAALTQAEPRVQLALCLHDACALSGAPDSRAKSLARAGLIDCGAESEVEAEAVEPGDFARGPELFLFRMFESAPDLAGVFKLNERIALDSSGWEIDLLARGARIAIEIDGYHHFQDADSYRRDRRKDLDLQEAGYLVLRFLAADVVPELDRLLETTRRALRSRLSPA
ncbi:MAG TPA: DUF559 domain-containing protein [Myxococcales bacterium]|jgi:very-short-patch-repair endonuclease